MINFVNGREAFSEQPGDTPLSGVIRDELGLTGTKFGCGIAQCGACTVHVNGTPVRSCSTPVSAAAGKKIATIEGLSPAADHPLQKAWIAEQVPQWLLPVRPDHAGSRAARQEETYARADCEPMNGNLCRCGTYPRIVRAIQRAAKEG